MKRPLPVTIISWYNIVTSVLGVFSWFFTINNPISREIMEKMHLSIPVQTTITFAGLSIIFISSILMLKGNKIGRLVYVSWCVISTIYGFAVSPMLIMMIPGLITQAAIITMLFIPVSSKYFNSDGSEDVAEIRPETAQSAEDVAEIRPETAQSAEKGVLPKVFSVIFYVASGFWFYMICFLAVVQIPVMHKLISDLIYLVIAALFFVPGAYLVGFKNWRKHLGVILLAVSCLTSFIILTLFCVLKSSEFINKQGLEFLNMFNDYLFAAVVLVIIAELGIYFLYAHKQYVKQAEPVESIDPVIADMTAENV